MNEKSHMLIEAQKDSCIFTLYSDGCFCFQSCLWRQNYNESRIQTFRHSSDTNNNNKMFT